MRRPSRLAIGPALVPLLAIGVWYRVSSLESLPLIDGDEAWHLVQLWRLLRGEPAAGFTPTGNPMCYLQAPLQAPLLLAFGPQPWIARAASAASGLAAIAMTYAIVARSFDRLSAAIASVLLAVLPVAIANSRLGYDSGLVPFAVLLMLGASSRTSAPGLAVAMAFGYLCHPTALFALPAALGLFAVRWRSSGPGDSPGSWRGLLSRTGLVVAVATALMLLTYGRAATQSNMAVYNVGPDGPHDPRRFASLLARFFLAVGREPRPWHDAAAWVAILAVVPAGLWRLGRQGCWDRLALVSGVAVGAAGLFVAGGSEILQPGMTRYGLALLVPACWAFAFLLRALLVEPRSGVWSLARRLQLAGLVAVAWLLLLTFDIRTLDLGRCQDAPRASESIWTPWVDVPDFRLVALDRLRVDDDREGDPGSRSLICDGWDNRWMLLLRCVDRPDVEVVDFEDPSRSPASILRQGGLVLARAGGKAEWLIPLILPPGALHREILERDGRPMASVFRRVEGAAAIFPVPGDYDGDGRDEPASYDADSGDWIVAGPGGMPVRFAGPADGIPAPGDYGGDGRLDLAVYRPDSGGWFAIGPGGPAPMPMRALRLGLPAPGDFDGDGRDEPATFDPGHSIFLSTEPGRDLTFGQGTEYGGRPIPAPADFDGDGRTDIAVYQADSGTWMLLRSSEGAIAIPTGLPGGRPSPGDLDGDGRADLVAFRSGSGSWEVVRDPTLGPEPLGMAADGLASAGDFDGDGRLDLVSFDGRSGSWSGPLSGGGSLAGAGTLGTLRR